MRKIILISLTISIVSINCFSQVQNFIDQNFIEVTGNAEIEIIPNEIHLKIVVNEKNFKGKESLNQMETSMIDKLVEIGIDVSKNLAVKDMASNFKNYWIKASEIKTVKIFQLKITNAKTLGLVFQQLESIGIANITIEKVGHSELQEFRRQVKVEAIKAAKSKAEALTNAINQSCGKAIYVQEINHQVYRNKREYASETYANMMIQEINSLNKAKVPTITFEPIKLEYSILVRFELN